MVLIQKWERQRGTNKRWKKGENRGAKDRKAFREGRRDDARQHVCGVFVHMCVSWVKRVCVSASHNQGQVACRQFNPVGPSKHSRTIPCPCYLPLRLPSAAFHVFSLSVSFFLPHSLDINPISFC